jgi:hypothetical protein
LQASRPAEYKAIYFASTDDNVVDNCSLDFHEMPECFCISSRMLWFLQDILNVVGQLSNDLFFNELGIWDGFHFINSIHIRTPAFGQMDSKLMRQICWFIETTSMSLLWIQLKNDFIRGGIPFTISSVRRRHA